MTEWRPGDRVTVVLPDRDLRGRGRGYTRVPVDGTVAEVKPSGGVLVKLDRLVNGTDYCTATPGELKPAGTEEVEGR